MQILALHESRGSSEVHVTRVRDEDNKNGRGRGDDSAPVCSPSLIKPVSLAFISMLGNYTIGQ